MRPTFISQLMEHARVTVEDTITVADLPTPVAEEGWHNVGGSGEVGFENGWAGEAGYNPIGYRRDGSGFVHLRGVARALDSTGETLFTMPVGWRPVNLTSLMVYVRNRAPAAGSSLPMFTTPMRLYVRPNGTVNMKDMVAKDQLVYLDAHRLRAA